MAEEPDHLDVTVGLGFQAAAGAGAVQMAVNVQLQQIRRSIARAACRLRNRADKPERREVQPVDKRLDEPHRVIPDSPDEMASGQLCASISLVRSSPYAGLGSRGLTNATGE